MYCEICGKEMYVVYINGEHCYICDNCYFPNEADDLADWDRMELGDNYG